MNDAEKTPRRLEPASPLPWRLGKDRSIVYDHLDGISGLVRIGGLVCGDIALPDAEFILAAVAAYTAAKPLRCGDLEVARETCVTDGGSADEFPAVHFSVDDEPFAILKVTMGPHASSPAMRQSYRAKARPRRKWLGELQAAAAVADDPYLRVNRYGPLREAMKVAEQQIALAERGLVAHYYQYHVYISTDAETCPHIGCGDTLEEAMRNSISRIEFQQPLENDDAEED